MFRRLVDSFRGYMFEAYLRSFMRTQINSSYAVITDEGSMPPVSHVTATKRVLILHFKSEDEPGTKGYCNPGYLGTCDLCGTDLFSSQATVDAASEREPSNGDEEYERDEVESGHGDEDLDENDNNDGTFLVTADFHREDNEDAAGYVIMNARVS